MIAVAQIGGHQALVEKGDVIEIDKVSQEEGEKINFEVLLISDEEAKDFQVGSPFIEGASVKAQIINHGRSDKVRVFKMKPRKRYRKLAGHRQDYTTVEILSIDLPKAKKAAAPTKEPAKKTETSKKSATAQTGTSKKS